MNKKELDQCWLLAREVIEEGDNRYGIALYGRVVYTGRGWLLEFVSSTLRWGFKEILTILDEHSYIRARRELMQSLREVAEARDHE